MDVCPCILFHNSQVFFSDFHIFRFFMFIGWPPRFIRTAKRKCISTARSLPGDKSTVPYIFQMQSIQDMSNALNSRPCKMLFRFFLFVCLSVLLAANSASYMVCLSLLIITCFFCSPYIASWQNGDTNICPTIPASI